MIGAGLHFDAVAGGTPNPAEELCARLRASRAAVRPTLADRTSRPCDLSGYFQAAVVRCRHAVLVGSRSGRKYSPITSDRADYQCRYRSTGRPRSDRQSSPAPLSIRTVQVGVAKALRFEPGLHALKCHRRLVVGIRIRQDFRRIDRLQETQPEDRRRRSRAQPTFNRYRTVRRIDDAVIRLSEANDLAARQNNFLPR